MIRREVLFNTIHDIRVLSVDFFSRGFGYIVFEGPDFLVDWGVASIRSEKEKQTLDRIQSFIALYRPHVLVMEDINEKPSRRCERIKAFAQKANALAEKEKLSVHRVSRAEVRQAFVESIPKTFAFRRFAQVGWRIQCLAFWPDIRFPCDRRHIGLPAPSHP